MAPAASRTKGRKRSVGAASSKKMEGKTMLLEAEERLEDVKSEVEKMGDIVTEQWIQFRHLEQALMGVPCNTILGSASSDYAYIATDYAFIATEYADIATDYAYIATDYAFIATDYAYIATDYACIATDFAYIATNYAYIATDYTCIATDYAYIATDYAYKS
ncbi:hypothetical protein QQ045_015225 [Rhodiola kirilowii]